ncbi:hypothetical protein ALC60_07470, partial [Trachymyrmex zeteki]
ASAALIAVRINNRAFRGVHPLYTNTKAFTRRWAGIDGSFLRAIQVLIISFLSSELRGLSLRPSGSPRSCPSTRLSLFPISLSYRHFKFRLTFEINPVVHFPPPILISVSPVCVFHDSANRSERKDLFADDLFF